MSSDVDIQRNKCSFEMFEVPDYSKNVLHCNQRKCLCSIYECIGRIIIYIKANAIFILRQWYFVNSLSASGDLCRLLITFANSSDPDQARQNIGSDLDSNVLTLMVFLEDFFEKVYLKISRRQKSMQNYPACKENGLWYPNEGQYLLMSVQYPFN